MVQTPSIYERALSWSRWISAIPRGTEDASRVSAEVAKWARAHALAVDTDRYGNLVIRKAATPGREGEPPLALQAHLDMVCQKVPGSMHDFACDSIELIEEDGWLHANGTTLGADDGAGVAICLAVIEDEDLPHPPLEIILTVDEEIGLVGAREMNCSIIQSRRMLNLDLTIAGQFVVGCCSGAEARIHLPFECGEKRCEAVGLALGASKEDIPASILPSAGTTLPFSWGKRSPGLSRQRLEAFGLCRFRRARRETLSPRRLKRC